MTSETDLNLEGARQMRLADANREAAANPDRVAVNVFVDRASNDMRTRMHEGLRRGWGVSFKDDYPDGAVLDRLERAFDHLRSSLEAYRVTGDLDELRKRAADVSNQAFMLADGDRLTRNP